MKVLVLGADGMIGNAMVRQMAQKFETAGTSRNSSAQRGSGPARVYPGIDARHFEALQFVLRDFRPNVIVNCIGLVKQKYGNYSSATGITLNSLLPQQLSTYCSLLGARLILLSTDCVFSGNKGNYCEADIPDAVDHYGRTKILGEIVDEQNVLTIRTSTIGLEQNSNKGLVEWFISQHGSIRGYAGAIYTGFTTAEFGRILGAVISDFPELSGLWHISSQPISKFDLLTSLRNKLQLNHIEIEKDETFFCNRSLNSAKFRQKTGYSPPTWDAMLKELSQEISSRGSVNND